MGTYTTPSANNLLRKYIALGYSTAQAWVLAVAEQEMYRCEVDLYFAKRERYPSLIKIARIRIRYRQCVNRILYAMAA